jgi:hypothetical protein
MPSTLQNLIASMLVENTGIHFMDSGGENGRKWQRNQGKTVQDFMKEPEVSIEFDPARDTSSEDIAVSLSAFHVLTTYAGLELDELCDTFNGKYAGTRDEWAGDYYGVTAKGQKWLDRNGFAYRENKDKSWNSYNWDSKLDTVLQGTPLYHEATDSYYCLLQVHGGADVRGGYTDARLFKVDSDVCGEGFLNLEPGVYGSIDGIHVSDRGDNLHLSNDETGEFVPLRPDSVIDVGISG